ncbi:hypothetical protein G5O_0683 [Chlamydia psittaci 6BC]|nr:hypothetical protein G5O_0683 [Chlamydia psittaci 6BC]
MVRNIFSYDNNLLQQEVFSASKSKSKSSKILIE